MPDLNHSYCYGCLRDVLPGHTCVPIETHEAAQERSTRPKISSEVYKDAPFEGDVCGPFTPERNEFGKGPLPKTVDDLRIEREAEAYADLKKAREVEFDRRPGAINAIRTGARLNDYTQELSERLAPQSLPVSAEARKMLPLATGLLDYFPAALIAVAGLSRIGNEQHNPGKPLNWDRSKSGDEADALLRHFVDRGTIDTDGVRHSTKVAWRALALLQKELEEAGLAPISRGSR